MTVANNGTHDVCQFYCPLDPRDSLDGGAAYFLRTNATDMGASTPVSLFSPFKELPFPPATIPNDPCSRACPLACCVLPR